MLLGFLAQESKCYVFTERSFYFEGFHLVFVLINQQQTSAGRGPPREGRGELPLAAVNSALLVATLGKTAEEFRCHQ